MFLIIFFYIFIQVLPAGSIEIAILVELAKNNWKWDSNAVGMINTKICQIVEENKRSGGANGILEKIGEHLGQYCNAAGQEDRAKIGEDLRQTLKEYMHSGEGGKIQPKMWGEYLKQIGHELEREGRRKKGRKGKEMMDQVMKEERGILEEIGAWHKMPGLEKAFKKDRNGMGNDGIGIITPDAFFEFLANIWEQFFNGENSVASKIVDGQIHIAAAPLPFDPLKKAPRAFRNRAIRVKRQNEQWVAWLGMFFIAYLVGIPLLMAVGSVFVALVKLAPFLLLVAAFVAAGFAIGGGRH